MEELFQNTDSFSEIIENLDFSINAEIGVSLPEIVFVKEPPKNLHPKIYIYLEFAEALDADAVYFRYYDDNRFCAPQVYFYDNTSNNRSKEDISEIHKKVYSSCQVPAICIIDKKYINIYDVRKPVEAIKETISNQKALFKKTPLEDLNILKTYFSAQSLNYGIFWESEVASKHFLNNKSAYEVLISELMKIRTELNILISEKISRGFVDDFLFKCILIKYLEENAKDVSGNYAKKFYKEKGLEYYSLKENIENRKLKELFSCLEEHFNGGVFHLSKDEEKILDELTQDDYYKIAALLDGKIQNQQLSIWEIYSFKHIPIELISNFYEEFIPKNEENKGTVYTPSFLVNFLIDECLPISVNETSYNVKLVDVSCGSGIFISTAFKRLVQRYRVANRKKGTNILDKSSLKLSEIKRILTENIFGVDKNETAVKLTKFSLQLALCQVVPNNELWNWTEDEVKIFDNLNQNIVCEDFFDFLIKDEYIRHHGSFDWVIGNPPFKKFKDNDEELLAVLKKLEKANIQYNIEKNPKRQLALLFLENLMFLSKKDTGRVCQILPSGEVLYFADSINFRKKYFSKYNIIQILDFTLLRRVLFTSKKSDTTVPVIALFAENKLPDKNDIIHTAVRRTFKSKEKIFFEIDYYDIHETNKNESLDNPFVWKSNLYGGRRCSALIDKYYSNKNIVGIKEHFKDINWGKKDNFLFRGKKSIVSSSFPTEKNDAGEAFLISSKKEATLKKFLDEYFLNEQVKKINNFFIACTSGRQGLRGAYTIIDSDIYNLPYVNIEEFSFSEKIIINDIYDYRIDEFGQGENTFINLSMATLDNLKDYADIFTQAFNTIYKKENKEQKLKRIIEGNSFFALEFYYSNEKHTAEELKSEAEIQDILSNQISRNAIINRIIKIYGDNTITFVKPKNLRYWLKSIALRDIDDVFADMLDAGY